LKGKAQPVEMDFTIQAKLVSTPTPLAQSAPTIATTAIEGSGPPGHLPAVQWSDTQNGLTAGMYFDPFPLRFGIASEFVLLLTNSDTLSFSREISGEGASNGDLFPLEIT